MILHKVLGQSAFWLVNKSIAIEFGIEAALLLSDLIDKQTYFEARGELDEEGFFYNTSEDIEKFTTLNYHSQKKVLKLLIEAGFVTTKLKGVPARLHFKILENQILIFLNTGSQEKGKQDLHNLEINNNKDNNNKEQEQTTLFDVEEIQPTAVEILNYLNLKRKSGTGFKNVKSNTGCINTRIQEGFKMQDFKDVIDGMIEKWQNDEKMHIYIRPETLFGTKFNSYLVASRDVLRNRRIDDGSSNFKYEPTKSLEVL